MPRRLASDVRAQLTSLILEQQLRSADTCTDAPSNEWFVLGREWTVLDRALGAQRSSLRLLRCRSRPRLPPQHGSVRQPARTSPFTAAIRTQLKVSRVAFAVEVLRHSFLISFQITSRPNGACFGECRGRLLQLPDDWWVRESLNRERAGKLIDDCENLLIKPEILSHLRLKRSFNWCCSLSYGIISSRSSFSHAQKSDKVALKNADGSFLFFAQLFSHFRPFFSRPLRRQIQRKVSSLHSFCSPKSLQLCRCAKFSRKMFCLWPKSNNQKPRAHLQQKSWDWNALEFVN